MSQTAYPSLSLIFRAHVIWRIDIVPHDEGKLNPPWAKSLGLPPEVFGPHGHEWPDNRAHVLNEHATWNIPRRRPLPVNLRRLEQVLPWFADRIAIDVTPDQRGFDVPPQADLFPWS